MDTRKENEAALVGNKFIWQKAVVRSSLLILNEPASTRILSSVDRKYQINEVNCTKMSSDKKQSTQIQAELIHVIYL